MHTPSGDSLEEKFSSCLAIMKRGGGVFNVKLGSGEIVISDIFDPDWILKSHDALKMLTVRIPSHGSFCLLHPEIVFWEEDRSDLFTLSEEE